MALSNSGPNPFRAKQRPPVKPQRGMPPGPGPMAAGSRPQINRSPMTMGGGPQTNAVPRAGVSSMVAPPPNGRMMANGGMAPMRGGMKRNGGMMAEGGFGAPEPLGGMGGPQGGVQGDMDEGADQGQQGPAAAVKPEALNYHDQEWECSKCVHFHGGNCEILQMEVNPEGACNAFEAGMDQDDQMGGQPGEDDNDTGMGTSGSY